MPEIVKQIEWDHMHKGKYFLYNSAFMLSLDCVLYPAGVVRTRLQIQRCNTLYKSTFDAFAKIARHEGYRGLYRGFLVSQIGIITGASYFLTYEVTRQKLSHLDEASRGFIAGFAAAVVDQCFSNPLQVVSQKRMLEGQAMEKPTRLRGAARIVFEVYAKHGPKGLYRGFLASLLAHGLDSAIWWCCYGVFLEYIGNMVPDGAPHLLVQGTAGALSGFGATVLLNPLDVIKTRLQVEGRKSMYKAFVELLKKEGPLALSKGMLPNLATAIPASVCAICGYETVKWFSLRQEMVPLYAHIHEAS